MRHANRTLLVASAAALWACTPSYSLLCSSSTECQTGYTCDLSSGKCVPGASKPEITLVTDTSGVFTGHVVLQMILADQKGISGVTGQLNTHPAVNGTNTAGDTWKVDIDTVSQGIGNETDTLTITATNKSGATNTATAHIQIVNVGPAITSLSLTPATVYAGQATAITFQVSEAVSGQPVVSLTPPGLGASPRFAQFVSVNGTAPATYTYSFAAAKTDPTGTWTCQVSAADQYHNVGTSSSPTLTVQADPSAPGIALSASGGTQGVGTELQAGASSTLTATFAKPLMAAQTAIAYLCPVAAGNPDCLSSSSGAISLTTTDAAGGTSYSFAVAPPVVAPQEGYHVVTVSGTNVSGETLSASMVFHFDFTPPTLAGIDFTAADVGTRDSGGDALFTTQHSGATPRNVHVAVQLTETPAPSTLVVNLDEGTAAQAALVTSNEQPDPFGAPEFYLTLDGSTLLDGTHTLTAHVQDLAGNSASPISLTFRVDSTDPVTSSNFAIQTNVTTPRRAGTTYGVQVIFDRPVAAWASLPISLKTSGGQILPLVTVGPGAVTPCGGLSCYSYDWGGSVPTGVGGLDGNYFVTLGGGATPINDSYGNPINSKTSGTLFSVLTTPPVVSWVSPATYVNGSGALFTFSASPALTTIANAQVCVDPTPTAADPCAGGNASNLSAVTAGTAANTAKVTVTAPASTEAQHVLVAKYTDAAGNVGFAPAIVKYDSIAPTETSFRWDKVILGPSSTATLTFSASEAIQSLSAGIFGGAGNIVVGTPVPADSQGNSWQIPFTMTSVCDGVGGNPADGVPFGLSMSFYDLAGNPVAVQPSVGTLTCVATPKILVANWNRTVTTPGQTIQLAVTLNEPAQLTNFNPGLSLSAAYNSQVSTSGGGFAYLVNYTMPGSCLGGPDPANNLAFTTSLSVTPVNGGSTQSIPVPGSIACITSSGLLSFSYDKTLGAPGTVVLLTIQTSAPMSSVSASGSGLSAATAEPIGTSGTSWLIPLTFSSTADCSPMPDGSAVAVSVSGNLAAGGAMGPTPAGQVTCSASRVTGTTGDNFLLQLSPFADGIVRTFVSATAGAVAGAPALNGVHIEVTDQSARLVGSGPVDPGSGSVLPILLTSNVIQAKIEAVDLVGNRTSIGQYPEIVELSFEGKDVTPGVADAGTNSIRAWDVTGTSAWFNPDVWTDGGLLADGTTGVYAADAGCYTSLPDGSVQFGAPGCDWPGPLPDGGVAELGPCNPDGGPGPYYCGLADPDGLVTTVTGGGTSDAGSAWIWDTLTTPASDGGVPFDVPAVRSGAMYGAIGNTIYEYGGCTDMDGSSPSPPLSCDELDGGVGVVYAYHVGQEVGCTQSDCPNPSGWERIDPVSGGDLAINFYNGFMMSDGTSFYIGGGLDTAGNGVTTLRKFDPRTATWTDTGDPANNVYPQFGITNTGSQTPPYSVNASGVTCAGNSRQMFAYQGYQCSTYLVDAPALCNGVNIRTFYEPCGSFTDWGAPNGQQGATMVWDSTNQQLWLFGGCNNPPTGSCTTVSNLFVGTWGGTSWTWAPVATTNSPPPRFYAAGFWDPISGHLVITGGFGNSGQTIQYKDIWEFDPSSLTWSDRTDRSPATRALPFPPLSANEDGFYPFAPSLTLTTDQGGVALFQYSPYYAYSDFSSQGHSIYVLRRETQERLLVKAPFPFISTSEPYPPYPPLQNLTIEIVSDSAQPTSHFQIWNGNMGDWVDLGGPQRNGFGTGWSAHLTPTAQNYGAYFNYFGYYSLLNFNSNNVGNIYLLARRTPGSNPGPPGNGRSLALDELRVRIKFK
jgi:hypothetical protein